MSLPKRKPQRLKDFDYSQNGMYFITICTQDRQQLFGTIENEKLILNDYGKLVCEKFEELSHIFSDIIVDKYILMPNHLHSIIIINNNCTSTQRSCGTTQRSFPTGTLSEYIRQFKTLTTKLYIDGVKNKQYEPFNKKVWQKSFHDHIIRNQNEYQNIYKYIDQNPQKWYLDEYYNFK